MLLFKEGGLLCIGINNLYFCLHHTNFLSPYDIGRVIAAFFFSGCAQRRKGKLFFLLCLGVTLAYLDVISGHYAVLMILKMPNITRCFLIFFIYLFILYFFLYFKSLHVLCSIPCIN